MTKQLRVYFVDILEAVEEIEEFTRSLTFDEFTKNKMAIRAVTMDFAIIGERLLNRFRQEPKENILKFPGSKWLEYEIK